MYLRLGALSVDRYQGTILKNHIFPLSKSSSVKIGSPRQGYIIVFKYYVKSASKIERKIGQNREKSLSPFKKWDNICTILP